MVEKCLCIKNYKNFLKGKEYKCEMGRFLYKILDYNENEITIGEFEFDEYFQELK